MISDLNTGPKNCLTFLYRGWIFWANPATRASQIQIHGVIIGVYETDSHYRFVASQQALAPREVASLAS